MHLSTVQTQCCTASPNANIPFPVFSKHRICVQTVCRASLVHLLFHVQLMRRCRTASPSPAKRLSAERRTEGILRQQARSTASTTQQHGPGSVPPNVGVWFHVVAMNETLQGFNIPDAWISEQLAALNSGFAGRVKFYTLGTTRTVNPAWVGFDAND